MRCAKFFGLGGLLALLCVIGLFTAPAQAAEPIKIGVYLPLTGDNAFGGQLELQGAQLAQKMFPTVLDRPVELIVVDNKSDAGSTSKCNTRCLTVSVFQKGCIGGFEPQALSWPPV